jgi:hypothetical protein
MENSEKVFFEYEDVKVTNTRFINGSNTFAMSGITSLKIRKNPPKYGDLIACAVLALSGIFMIATGDNTTIGLLITAFFGIGFWVLFKSKKTEYFIMLATAGGEAEGLKTNQLEYAESVTKALNEAIIYRN